METRARAGYSTNLFSDAFALRGGFAEAGVTLAAAKDFGDWSLKTELSHDSRRIEGRSYGDEQASAAAVAFEAAPAAGPRFALAAGIKRLDAGDLLAALGGLEIGSRSVDHEFTAQAAVAADHFGGTTRLEADYADMRPGVSDFTLAALTPARLEANLAQYAVEASHVRPAGGGEAGLAAEMRQSMVPGADRLAYERFEALTLRGSAGYGRRFGETLTVRVNAGLAVLSAAELGGEPLRKPYLDAEAMFAPVAALTLTAGARHDFETYDSDDPVGEYVRLYRLAVAARLGERLSLEAGAETRRSEHVYYIYETRTDELSAGLEWAVAKSVTASADYAFVQRTETDSLADYSGHQFAAGLEGRF